MDESDLSPKNLKIWKLEGEALQKRRLLRKWSRRLTWPAGIVAILWIVFLVQTVDKFGLHLTLCNGLVGLAVCWYIKYGIVININDFYKPDVDPYASIEGIDYFLDDE